MGDNEESGKQILTTLINLKKQDGTIDFERVGQAFEGVSNQGVSGEVKREIAKLLEFVEKAKSGAQVALVSQDGTKISQDANDQLSAIVENTEEATGAIIDAVSVIGDTAREKLDAKDIQTIDNEVSKIYEACNFQDLTAQRIRKVTNMINTIEERLTNVVELLGTSTSSSAPVAVSNSDDLPLDDSELLNGPQLSDKAPSQAEVDALFDSL